jgi:hypothetical protein
MTPATDNKCVVMLTLLLKVAQNNTAYMSSEAASGTNLDAASRGDKNEEV